MKRKRTVVKRVLQAIGKYKIWLAASLVLALLTVALTLYAPILVGDAIDYILGPGDVEFAALCSLLARIAAIVGATSLLQWAMNLCNNRITYRVVMDVRTAAFDHLERLPLKYVDSHSQGGIVSRLVADVDQFSDGLLM